MSQGKPCTLIFVALAALHAESDTQIAEAIHHGQVLHSQGRFIEAEAQLQSVVRAALGGSTAPDLQATALSTLASVEIDLSRLDEAARLYVRAIAVLKEQPEGESNHIQVVRVRLAELYLEGGQTDVAGKLLRPFTARLQRQTGTPTPATAYALDVLASIYACQRKFPEAETAERQSLMILEELGNIDAASVPIGMVHLSLFLNLRDKPGEALPYARHALELLSALPLPQPSVQAYAEMNLASIYSRAGRHTEALLESQQAMRTAEQYYGPDNPRVAWILLAQAAVLRRIGNKQEARVVQARGEQILNRGRATRLDSVVPLNALLPN